jgi:hypothetical protein
MLVTVTTDGEEMYNLDIDSQMAIEDLKALLEAEVQTSQRYVSNDLFHVTFFNVNSLVLLLTHNAFTLMVKNSLN